MRDYLSTAVLGLIAVALVVGGWSLGQEERVFTPITNTRVPVDLAKLKGKILDSEVVGTGQDARVRYAFVGERVSDKLDPEEVEWMRTESSWTINRTSQNDYDKGEYGLETRIYPQPVFTRAADGWRSVEYGEAPKKEYDQAMAGPLWFTFLPRVAHAETVTTNVFSGSGDGYVYAGGLGATWDTAHDATDGSLAWSIGATMDVSATVTSGKFGSITIGRVFIPFDTSVISSQATISSATLNIYTASIINTDNDGSDYLTVVQTSQAAHTTLVAADYDQCGSINSPTEGIDAGQRKDITSISTSAYTSFTLNSTGRGWIKKNGETSNCSSARGISCFGIREGHDTTDVPITDDTNNSVSIYAAEQTGTANDPYLSVTYTVPQAVLSGGVWLGGGGAKLNVVGGRVQIN